MAWVFAVLLVALIGGVVVVAAGRGEAIAPADQDDPDPGIPATGPLTAAVLRRVRFNVAFRGYRAAEVDRLITRLADQIDNDNRGTGTAPPPRPPSAP